PNPHPGRAESTADSTAESTADRRILVINFEKSPSEFNHPIENPSEINLLEINFGKSPFELFALACGPTLTSISINSCVVDGLRYVVHSRDERLKVKRLVLRNNMTQIDTKAESFKDDITDDEDALPHDLAESNNEDLINVDDDGVDKVYSSEEED
nr:hypothetical protein [Tanacetum cinerariifolium]